MLRLYKMSDSTVFKQKDTGLATSLRYFRAPVMQASHSISVKNALIQILKGCIKRLKLVGNREFFNLLTTPELLSTVEELLPEHRERLYPST